MSRLRLGRRAFLVAAAGGAAALTLPTPYGLSAPRLVKAQRDEPARLIRVVIRRADGTIDGSTMSVTGDGEFAVSDGKGEIIQKIGGKKSVVVGRDGDDFWFQVGDEPKKVKLAGPLRFNGTGDGAPLRNHANTGPEPTAFRGTLEVTASPENRVALVNVLALEDYLYGVVTKELPASFGQEPLRAQAVAARTYTLARRIAAPHKAQSADICDGQHCQAFGGLSAELAAGRTAVDATRGKILMRGGSLFEPFYSSACGGHTETPGRIFGGATAIDDAVADGDVPGGLDTDSGALKFFKNPWDSYCSASNRYRWSYSWDADELKATVTAGLARFQGSSTIAGGAPDARVEQIEAVAIPERGPSGRALSVRFDAPGVSWTVRRDWGIRNFMRTPAGELLPSSAIALQSEHGVDGKLSKLTVFGAGWGHGSGMCQWGTRGLAAKGAAFDAILGHYYPSAELKDAPAG